MVTAVMLKGLMWIRKGPSPWPTGDRFSIGISVIHTRRNLPVTDVLDRRPATFPLHRMMFLPSSNQF